MEATAAIIDSPSAKTSDDCADVGYDAGKRIKGRKRHILVDTLGLIIAVVISAASVQDRDGAKLVFADAVGQTELKKVSADGGYRDDKRHASTNYETTVTRPLNRTPTRSHCVYSQMTS